MEMISAEEETTILLGLKAIIDTLPPRHYRRVLAQRIYEELQDNHWLYKITPLKGEASNDG